LSDAPASSDELSSDVPSSFIEDVSSSPPVELSSPTDSSPEQLVRRSHRLRRPPDCYSPSAFTVTALSEPASYRYAILHPEWQHVMVEEIAALERTSTWDLVPCPPCVHLITYKWVYKVKTRCLLNAIRLVLLLVVFNRSKVEIMMRLLLLLLI
jgi:hypothetical protein